jgi:VCBS repeat-containing protein
MAFIEGIEHDAAPPPPRRRYRDPTVAPGSARRVTRSGVPGKAVRRRPTARIALAVATAACIGIASIAPVTAAPPAGLLPVAVDDTSTVVHGRTRNVAAPGVLSNDLELGTGFTAELVTAPSHGSLDLDADGSHQYTADMDHTAPTSSATASTVGLGLSNTATVRITVTNKIPVAHADSYEAIAGSRSRWMRPGCWRTTRRDGDELTVDITSEPTHATQRTRRRQLPVHGRRRFRRCRHVPLPRLGWGGVVQGRASRHHGHARVEPRHPDAAADSCSDQDADADIDPTAATRADGAAVTDSQSDTGDDRRAERSSDRVRAERGADRRRLRCAEGVALGVRGGRRRYRATPRPGRARRRPR